MNILHHRHTFHYLDIPNLDNCFKEFDVLTYMVEGDLKHKAARAVYQTSRAVAIGVQMVAFAILSTMKMISNAACSLNAYCKKGVVLFLNSPTAVKKRFTPSKADLLEQRMESLCKALKGRHVSADAIAEKLSHDEKKELMQTWMKETLGTKPEEPLLQELCELMNKIADRDIGEDLWAQAEERVEEIFKEDATLMRRFIGLHSFATVFIQIFNNEKKYEDNLNTNTIENDFNILLKHPNLLKREDVAKIIHLAPSPLKESILRKKNEVMQRALSHSHKEEQKFLSTLEKIKTLSEQELEEQYSSRTEDEYLFKRTALVRQRIQELLAANPKEKSFEQRFFEFELYHLERQEKKRTEAHEGLHNLIEHIDEANHAIEEHAVSICALISRRISSSLQALEDKGQNVKSLRESFNKLSDEKWEEFFREVQPICQELQKLEMSLIEKGTGESAYLNRVNQSLVEYESYTQKMNAVQKEAAPWKTLNEITQVKQRDEERKNNFAKDAIRLSMEKRPECQLPLLLSKQDARSQAVLRASKHAAAATSNGEAKAKIEQAAQEFVSAVQDKHCERFKAKLLTFTEFAAELRNGEQLAIIDPVQQQKEAIEKKGPEFQRLALELELTEELNRWHARLQEIWLEHMPREQEEVIKACSNARVKKIKMSELFEVWLETLTGKKLTTPLSFDRIGNPDNSALRKEAIESRLIANSNFHVRKFVEKIRQKIASDHKDQALAKPLQGFSSELIGNELSKCPITDPVAYCQYLDLQGNPAGFEDFISALEKARRKLVNQAPGIDQSVEWVRTLTKNPLLKNASSTRFMVIAECRQIIQESYAANLPVPGDIQEIFLNAHKTDKSGLKLYDFDKMNNRERGVFLASFLQMLFAGGAKYTLTEKQRSHFIQLLALSALPQKDALLASIDVGAVSNPAASALLEEVGHRLQLSTSVRLEGVEESTLQKSFQLSNLPETPETRALLDAERAVSSEELSLSLLPYVYAKYPLNHDQGREAIARALLHAFAHHPEAILKHATEKMDLHKNDMLNPKTLAPPLCEFYKDILLELEPTLDIDLHFNNQLIASKDANQMLMGYARLITYYSRKDPLTAEQFYVLLKCKIAYQNLKLNYFEGKKEIAGFLKVAADAAESSMMTTAPRIRQQLENPDFLEALKDLVEKERSPEFSAQLLLKELSNCQGQKTFTNTVVPGIIAFGTRIKIDGATGIVYNDGRQQVNLPPHLQNHPAVISLGISNLPYTWDARENTFVYYTKENGRHIPQIIVKEVNGEPVIHKRLSTTFQPGSQSDLQFVQKENIVLPIAALHRMGVKTFWQDRLGSVFGYDKEGQLAFSLHKGNPCHIKTRDGGSYTFISENDIQNYSNHPVLSRLFSSFNPNEILISLDKKAYLIPALSLKLTREMDKSGEIYWVTERKGMGRKILDITRPKSSCLIFRNENNEHKAKEIRRKLKEENYRLQLDQADGLSYLDKHVIKSREQTIAKLSHALTVLEERTFLTTLPDDAYIEEEVQGIVDLIPAGIRAQFKPKSPYPYEVYHEALVFLNEKLSEAARKLAVSSDNKLQETVHLWLKAYQAIRAKYEKTCDRSLEAVLFSESSDTSVLTSDLTAALAIALKGMEKGAAPLRLIQELAKYPLDKPLTDAQVRLLEQAIGAGLKAPVTDEQKQLNTYLQLLQYLHLSYKMQELSHTPLSDKKQWVDSLKSAHAAAGASLGNSIKQLPANLSKELVALWKKAQFDKENPALKEVERKEVPFVKHVNPAVEGQFQLWGSQTLLERLSREDAITAVHKNPADELSPHHESLIRAFQKHSHDQVIGFHLEELGNFNLDGLYEEFRVNHTAGTALHGLKKSDVDSIFAFLIKERVISRPAQSTNYYYLTSVDKAITEFPANQVRALLTHLPLSEEQLTKITNRLQSFLFRAMLSGFKFSFKEGVEKALDKELESEKQIHLQKWLEAEAALKAELPNFNASYVDLKYALLSDDYTKFGNDPAKLVRLTNGMIRYMFHKTEVQHIENVQKAPAFGERNKIELLLTRRNYPVDLLLQEGLKGEKRKEQIMQRAFLAFEEDYGYRCNVLQIKMFHSLILDTNHEEAIDAAQARMGFGKTALLPLMSIVRVALERKWPEEDKHLVRYVVPRAVIEDNKSSFNQRFSAIVGGNVLKDRDFARYQIDQDNPEESFKLAIADLESRLTFYRKAKEQGNVLIQWPEIRGAMEAQELDFGEMIIKGGIPRNILDLCLEAKRLLGEIRSIPTYTVFDELDDTQDIKSREVNFTRGDKNPIPRSTIRPLERLLTYVENNKGKDWKNLEERARDLVTALCTDRNGDPIVNCHYELIKYLTQRNEKMNDPTKNLLSQALADHLNDPKAHHTENDSMLMLIRALLLDENILALAKSKQPSTHFGARFIERDGERVYFADPDSESTLLIAVPYEGTNTPKGLSIFDNTEVAAITTMRYYRSPETLLSIKPHLDFLVKQVQRGAIPEHMSQHYLQGIKASNGSTVIEWLEQIAGMLDAEERRVAKEKFYKEFMANPSEDFRKFFAMAVVVTQIKSDEACAKSDRYEKGSCDNIEKGCSGTVGGTSSYFARQETDAAADGKLSIEIMGRSNNAVIQWLTSPTPGEDYLKAIIRTLLANSNENTRAIVDAAGMCKSRDGTPEAVVAELWNQLKADPKFAGIEGIVYYGRDNIKRLYRGGSQEAIPCTTAMELAALDEKKYFSFYGQKNTRGSDIKQANGAHSLVTLDENVSNSDAKQAVLRFRNLVNRDSNQTFSFAVMPSFEAILKETLTADAKRAQEESQRELVIYQDALQNQTALPGQAKFDKKMTEDGISALKQQLAKIQKRLNTIHSMQAREMQTREIANFLRLQEKNREEKGALSIFRKEMKAHIKQAGAHLEASILAKLPKPLKDEQKAAYEKFLTEKSAIVSFVEYSINTLYLKYGIPTTNTARDLYIKEQTELANRRLNDLFDTAGRFAAAAGSAISVKKEFYQEHIERSKNFFKERFDEHTPVQTLHVNADGEAVAEAQAQAEAEAEATSLAEKLAEGIVEVLDRFQALQLKMASDPHLTVTLDFLDDNTQLTEIEKFNPMKNLIRPDQRKHFKVSPAIANNPLLASHFALIGSSGVIFIAQQEAELFAKELKAHNVNELKGYKLFDARTLKEDTVPQAQVRCAVLGDNKIPKDRVEDTITLRATSLVNVESDQLVPHLHVKGPDDLNDYFIPGEFGVGRDMEFAIAINEKSVPDQFKLAVKAEAFTQEITIPTKNEILMKEIQDEFAKKSVRKFEAVHTKIEADLQKYLPKLAELKRKEAELEALNQKDKLAISQVKAFDLTSTMKSGLRQRDDEYTGRGDLAKIGKKTIEHVEKIVKLQGDLRTDPSPRSLKALQESFDQLVSTDIVKKASASGFNFKTSTLFDEDTWNRYQQNLSQVPFLEQTYGRIVYNVHKGNTKFSPAEGCTVLEAQTCNRDDCHNMFAQVIPNLIQSVGSINKTIADMAAREAERKKIRDEIEEIQKKYAPLIEALRMAKEIVDAQGAIEKVLQEKGMFYHQGQFFDQFDFSNEDLWELKMDVALKTSMPNYHYVVEDMKTYQRTLKALTQGESEEMQKNKKFLANVMDLSRKVEEREEIAYI